MSRVSKLKLLKPYGSIEREKQLLGDIVEVIGTKFTTKSEFIAALKGVDILMADVDIKVSKDIIHAADKLKAIICCSQGVDYVDLNTATEKGVLVCNIPDYCVVAVAEHALCLAFAIARKIVNAHNAAVSGKWNERRKFRGIELEGKTLGIIGIGKIGKCLAFKAKNLGMKVIAYHPNPKTKEEVARELGADLTGDLTVLLKNSDIVSIHVPLNNFTKGLIGEKELKMMKKSAFFINCARGPIIDEKALIKALREGWIAGAALDVLENEPPHADNPLLGFDNVIITPHIAWNTEDASVKAANEIREEVLAIVQGHVPKNVVNKEVLKS
jgi:D-3-phosphoglycerate dehydrogenase